MPDTAPSYKERLLRLSRHLMGLKIEDQEFKDLVQYILSKQNDEIANESQLRDMVPRVSLKLLEFLTERYEERVRSILTKNETLKDKFRKLLEVAKKLNKSPYTFGEFELVEGVDSEGVLWIRYRDRSRSYSAPVAMSKETTDKIIRGELGSIGQLVKINSNNIVIDFPNEHPGEGGVCIVTSVLEQGKVMVQGHGDSQTVIALGRDLDKQNIQSGDMLLVSSGGFGLARLPKTDSKGLELEEVEDINWDQIGGLTDQIVAFRKAAEQPYLKPRAYKLLDRHMPKAGLLVGPPGCGKTTMAKTLIKNIALTLSKATGRDIKPFVMLINGPADILRMFVGQSPGMVKAYFDIARQKAKEGHIVLVVADECESWLSIRSSSRLDSGVGNEVVSQVNVELDGMRKLDGVFLVWLSNRPDMIDSAVMRRMDFVINIPRPDKDGAEDIFRKLISSKVKIHGKYFDPKNYEDDWYYPRDERGKRRLVPGTNDYERYKLQNDRNLVVAHFASKVMGTCYGKKERQIVQVSYQDGSEEIFSFADFMSGAMIAAIIEKAKDPAIDRINEDDLIGEGEVVEGLKLKDLYDGLDQVVKEGKSIPTTPDTLQEWLKVEGKEVKPIKTVELVPRYKNLSSKRRDKGYKYD